MSCCIFVKTPWIITIVKEHEFYHANDQVLQYIGAIQTSNVGSVLLKTNMNRKKVHSGTQHDFQCIQSVSRVCCLHHRVFGFWNIVVSIAIIPRFNKSIYFTKIPDFEKDKVLYTTSVFPNSTHPSHKYHLW